MKKLKLKLEGKATLTKEQMKAISGGYSSCAVFCVDEFGILTGRVDVDFCANVTQPFLVCLTSNIDGSLENSFCVCY